jgi:glycosyltransferase involved in cell wall biosynthesis
MKVLIVHPRLDISGGAELVIEKLARHLTARGIENTVLTTTFDAQVSSAFKGINVQVHKMSVPLAGSGLNEILSLWMETGRIGREYDLINAHNFPAEMVSFLLPRPVVWMCNEPPVVHLGPRPLPDSIAEMKKRILLCIDRLIVGCSIKHVVVADEFNATRFRSLYHIEPRIIPYGIDYDYFSSGDGVEAIREFGLDGHFVVIQVGTLTPLKNQLESLKALVQLKDSIPSLKLIMAGHGNNDYSKGLESFIHQHGLEERVIITGHLNRETIRNLYKGCNLLLHPIRSQGGWLTPFEALCAGMPVIVSREMTAGTILERERLGQVTDDYARAVLYAYEHQQECRAEAQRGGQWVREHLSWDVFGNEMVRFFEYVISHGSESIPGKSRPN